MEVELNRVQISTDISVVLYRWPMYAPVSLLALGESQTELLINFSFSFQEMDLDVFNSLTIHKSLDTNVTSNTQYSHYWYSISI